MQGSFAARSALAQDDMGPERFVGKVESWFQSYAIPLWLGDFILETLRTSESLLTHIALQRRI
jgi:hypothetical protein